MGERAARARRPDGRRRVRPRRRRPREDDRDEIAPPHPRARRAARDPDRGGAPQPPHLTGCEGAEGAAVRGGGAPRLHLADDDEPAARVTGDDVELRTQVVLDDPDVAGDDDQPVRGDQMRDRGVLGGHAERRPRPGPWEVQGGHAGRWERARPGIRRSRDGGATVGSPWGV